MLPWGFGMATNVASRQRLLPCRPRGGNILGLFRPVRRFRVTDSGAHPLCWFNFRQLPYGLSGRTSRTSPSRDALARLVQATMGPYNALPRHAQIVFFWRSCASQSLHELCIATLPSSHAYAHESIHDVTTAACMVKALCSLHTEAPPTAHSQQPTTVQ